MGFIAEDKGESILISEGGRQREFAKGAIVPQITPSGKVRILDTEGKVLYDAPFAEATPNTMDGFRAIGLGVGSGASGDGVRTPVTINDTTAVELIPTDSSRNGFTVFNTSGRQAFALFGLGDASNTVYSVIIPDQGYFESPSFAAKSRVSIIRDSGGGSTGDVQLTVF